MLSNMYVITSPMIVILIVENNEERLRVQSYSSEEKSRAGIWDDMVQCKCQAGIFLVVRH